MRLILSLVLLLAVTVFARSRRSQLRRTLDNRVNIWPHPSAVETLGNSAAVVKDNASFKITLKVPISPTEDDILQDAFNRFKEITFYEKLEAVPQTICQRDVVCVESVVFDIKSSAPSLSDSLGSHNESYSITIKEENTIYVSAPTIWGGLHALETLSQMIQIESRSEVQVYSFVGFTIPLKIVDSPRFSWRGLLVDTSRHYISVPKMRQIIDSLTYIKMNVLHWHIVDSDSFPVFIPDYPELSGKGAYSTKAIYTQQDVESLVDYAYRRGVNIVFEFDMPGHTVSWGAGIPEIMAKCPSLEPIMNPTVDKTYEVIDAVFAYVKKVTKNSYIHIGGDEIATQCWKADKQIQQWMKQKGYSSVDELLSYFERRVLDLLKKHSLSANVWEEVLLNYNQSVVQLPKDTVVTAWTTIDKLPKIIKAGYPSILSAGWYLDQQNPNNVHHYSWVDTWISFYNIEPYSIANFTQEEKKLLIGGEACMWGEAVDDINFDSRVFPRVLAVAERLWSKEEMKQVDGITRNRINHHRCNMVRRGVQAGPVSSGYCDASYTFKKMSWQ
ncbi:hexosaminidase [Acrasis kona]|uniref:Beta-hexosaminidase n=1 Tax=Acrasis kona TaxID=1008807 RepID=A0AAW2Z6A2_9EUKA